MFRQFVTEVLDTTVGRRTTLIVTGDGRDNFRDPGTEAFREDRRPGPPCVLARSRKPRADWFVDDSAMGDYVPLCDGVFEVSTLRSLGDAIAELV